VPVPPEVIVHVPGPLRDYCGGKARLGIRAGTVLEVLDQLERTQPALHRNIRDEAGNVRRHLNVFVNSDHIRDRDGLATALAEGDVVTFLPAVSGG